MILLAALLILGVVGLALHLGWPDFAVSHPYRGDEE